MRCGLHIRSVQHGSRPARWSDEFAAKWSSGNTSPSSERVRLLQPLHPRPKEGWCSKAHSRSQTSESHPYEMAIQNDHIKTDPLASMPRGLVLFAGSERRLLSHRYSPPPQAVLEICLRGSGLLIHGPSLWAVPCSPHFYEVHGCGSFSAETAGNLHLELPRGLAHPGPVGGRASISQIHAPQPLRVSRNQGKFYQERGVPQSTNFGPGNSYRLSPNEGCGHARACTGHSAARSFIQTWSPSPPQSISEDAGSHCLSVFGTSVGPASNLAPSVLAETSSSSTRLASGMPPYQGEPSLCCSSGTLEEPAVDGTGRAPGHGVQKEGCLDRRLQLRMRGAVRWQTGLRTSGRRRFIRWTRLRSLGECPHYIAKCPAHFGRLWRAFQPWAVQLRWRHWFNCGNRTNQRSCSTCVIKKGFRIREKWIFH